MPDGSLSLHDGVAVLKKHYGSPAPLPTADPFELILWENVAYLASPRRRHEVVQEQGSYSRTYAASRQAAKDLSADPSVIQEAHLLLQQHGQTLCKRRLPHCGACPLERRCAYARGAQQRA